MGLNPDYAIVPTNPHDRIIEETLRFPNILVQGNIPLFQIHNIAKPTVAIYLYTISNIHRKKPTSPDPLKNQQHPIIPNENRLN